MAFWEWFSTKFHRHQWEIVKEMPLKIYKDDCLGQSNKLVISGLRYTLQCKVCGEVKFKDSI